ncbi:MAG: hypothetical protein PVSMB10_06240 [Pseudarthrobacter sp.]
MALAPAADAHQPGSIVLRGEFRHHDIGIHEPVLRDRLLHHRESLGRDTEMFGQRLKELLARVLPVGSGVRQLDQHTKVVDKIPQFFIHAQTLAASLPSDGRGIAF